MKSWAKLHCMNKRSCFLGGQFNEETQLQFVCYGAVPVKEILFSIRIWWEDVPVENAIHMYRPAYDDVWCDDRGKKRYGYFIHSQMIIHPWRLPVVLKLHGVLILEFQYSPIGIIKRSERSSKHQIHIRYPYGWLKGLSRMQAGRGRGVDTEVLGNELTLPGGIGVKRSPPVNSELFRIRYCY